MKDVRILVVAREGEARDAYEAELQRLGISFDIVSSFGEIPGLACDRSYNGLLLDVVTLVRTRKDEKNLAYECINYYPSTRIKWDAKMGRITLLFFEESGPVGSESSLETFIAQRCRKAPLRTIRKFTRKEIVLNVRLARDALSIRETGVKTFSVNLSRGGAFIHTVEKFSRGETVWLQFEEFVDRAPVRCEVCWWQAWGERRAIAGVGIKFTSLSESQEAELCRLLRGGGC